MTPSSDWPSSVLVKKMTLSSDWLSSVLVKVTLSSDWPSSVLADVKLSFDWLRSVLVEETLSSDWLSCVLVRPLTRSSHSQLLVSRCADSQRPLTRCADFQRPLTRSADSHRPLTRSADFEPSTPYGHSSQQPLPAEGSLSPYQRMPMRSSVDDPTVPCCVCRRTPSDQGVSLWIRPLALAAGAGRRVRQTRPPCKTSACKRCTGKRGL